jgi:predicted nuclease of restriction endonuclease-like (RecB) superfamily
LIRIEKEVARNWYTEEAADQNWSVRALQRQINAFYYDRLQDMADPAAHWTAPGNIGSNAAEAKPGYSSIHDH